MITLLIISLIVLVIFASSTMVKPYEHDERLEFENTKWLAIREQIMSNETFLNDTVEMNADEASEELDRRTDRMYFNHN